MSILERVSQSGSDELPDCRCGKKMDFAEAKAVPQRYDTHIRIYRCPSCQHELRLTVWSADTAM